SLQRVREAHVGADRRRGGDPGRQAAAPHGLRAGTGGDALIPLLAAIACTAAAPCAFENVRVETGDGAVLDSATVVMDGAAIRGVGSAAVPAGAVRIDGRGKVLTPGLVETRSQLGIVE